MSRRKDEAYIFACARIRSNERSLLSDLQFEKMVTAKDLAEAAAVLAEAGYEVASSGGASVPGAQTPSGTPVGTVGRSKETIDSDRILTAEQNKLYDVVRSALPDAQEISALLLPGDYHNLKVLLKAEFLKTDPAPLMVSTGTIDPVRLQEMLRERSLADLSPCMRQGVEQAIAQFAKNADPQQVDFILDRACYQDMAAAAERLGNAFIIGYVRRLIDCLNVKAFVRLRRMGKSFESLREVFLPGGTVPESLLTDVYEEPLSRAAELLMTYGFQPAFSEGGADIEENGRFTRFERMCDDFLMEYIRQAKYVSFGIEPVAAYLLAKESELKTVRILLAGKAANLPPAQIRERMRAAYV